MSLRRLLLPEEHRHFPGRMWVRVLCRSLHILCIGMFVGGTLYGAPARELTGWLHGAITTGSVLILTDLYASFIYLAELRGLAMLVKLGLLGALHWIPEHRVPVLIGIVLGSSIVSHMSSRWRHWTLGVGAPTKAQKRSGKG